ncbi:MAG: hypothetical protein WD063_08110 [Pirellulales bacterium]
MFGSKKTVKIDKDLYVRLTEVASKQGYSSTQELIIHLCEREIAATLQEKLDQSQVEQQLRGLGYIE